MGQYVIYTVYFIVQQNPLSFASNLEGDMCSKCLFGDGLSSFRCRVSNCEYRMPCYICRNKSKEVEKIYTKKSFVQQGLNCGAKVSHE